MKRALLSDIHGNLEALTAVLADVRAQGVSEIFCLGDIVGYGPNPCECVDAAQQFQGCVLGNHDQGALYDPEGFSSGAERAIFWTREQLENRGAPGERAARWSFLSELPRMVRNNGALYVHGSARNPLNEYVFPEDVYNTRKLEKIFVLIERYCFQGHTHVPGVFTHDGRFLGPSEIAQRYALGADKAMVNVGSVGQPRDGDPRACYVILDYGPESPDDAASAARAVQEQPRFGPPTVHFRRVEYPVDITAQKIYDTPELDNFLGDRLREGR